MKKETTKLSTVKKNISSQVLAKINILQDSGEMRLPKDYSAENALKSAYLILVETKNKQGQYALEHCTQESIANSLLKMVVLGLSVMKKQCNLIMYADKLSCDLEYAGTIILAKRYGKLKDINAVTIYSDDEFEFEIDISTGRKKIIKHTQKLESLGGGKDKIKGAYAVMEFEDGTFDAEIMSMAQIQNSWAQGGAKGNSGAHNKFTDQMAEKTVINRACKLLIRGSDDNVLFYAGSNTKKDVTKEDMQHAISTEANQEEISLDETKIIEVEAETVDETVENIEAKSTKIEETPNVKEVKKEVLKEDIKIKSERKPLVDKDGQANLGGPGF